MVKQEIRKYRIGNQRNLILSKNKMNLGKIDRNYSREKLFSKRRPDGIQVKEYYFQNESNPR